MRGQFLAAGLLNIAALSALFISNIGWKCEQGYLEAASRYIGDAPSEWTQPANDDGDGIRIIQRETTTTHHVEDLTPSYLQWDAASPPKLPPNWSFKQPRFCKNTNLRFNRTVHGKQKIIVHYHMQHNAGTNFWAFAKDYAPCATRACWQEWKHCMVSYNEEVEAENIRQNYEKYGIQYVSYEMMLPPRFPLPFVSETARQGLFFTTIVRDPFKRFLTYVRRHNFTDSGYGSSSPFWIDLQGKQGSYSGDNLNARWLSGAKEHIDSDHVNIAKCRLQLFDLVIADKFYDIAVKQVMCPLNNWKGKRSCNNEIQNKNHTSKPDPLNGTDPLLIGAWLERLRPSFEVYDYARLLSLKQLKERGVEDIPDISEVPSYMETLAKYTKLNVSDAHFNKIKRVSLKNEKYFDPPVEFCNRMKQVWSNNPDEVPNVYGIGTINDGKLPGHFIYTENL